MKRKKEQRTNQELKMVVAPIPTEHLNLGDYDYESVTSISKRVSHSRGWVYAKWRAGLLTGYRLPGESKLYFRLSELQSQFQKVEFKYRVTKASNNISL